MSIQAQRIPQGVVLGCTVCGQQFLAQDDWQAHQFQVAHAGCGYYGAGELVARVAKPIARAIGLDPDCAPCAEREGLLNRLWPRAWRR
jgi:hypothetical protein